MDTGDILIVGAVGLGAWWLLGNSTAPPGGAIGAAPPIPGAAPTRGISGPTGPRPPGGIPSDSKEAAGIGVGAIGLVNPIAGIGAAGLTTVAFAVQDAIGWDDKGTPSSPSGMARTRDLANAGFVVRAKDGLHPGEGTATDRLYAVQPTTRDHRAAALAKNNGQVLITQGMIKEIPGAHYDPRTKQWSNSAPGGNAGPAR